MANKHEKHEATDASATEASANEASTAAANDTPYVTPRKKFDLNSLNTLAVVSIATALTGFGAVAGVITGHVALNQLKTDGKSGRGLAIAGVVVGYAGIAFAVLGTVFKIGLGLWGARNGFDFGGRGGFGDHGGSGMMGGFGDDRGGFGQGGQNGQGFMNGGQGGMMIVPDSGNGSTQQNN